MLQRKLDAGVAFAAGICIKKAPPPFAFLETDEVHGEIAFENVPSAGEEIQQGRDAPHARREGASVAAGQAGCHGAQSHRQARRKARREACRQKRPMGLCLRRRQGAKAARDMRNLLGGKGAGLAEMAHLGLPVPPGFTITTEVCTYFYEHDKTYPKDLEAAGRGGARPGRPHHRQEISAISENPLLVSVRSGARASMPGMMDTVLNLGLNDVTVAALAEKSGDRALRL